MSNIPRKFRKETTVQRLDGVYIGIIRVVADPQRFGRLQVWIPDFGPDENDSYVTVSYASPFAGVSDISIDSPDSTGSGQTSYGFWATPPDINNQVLCCFVNGDIAKGYWFACLYPQNMNHMVPGIGSQYDPSEDTSPTADGEEAVDSIVPVSNAEEITRKLYNGKKASDVAKSLFPNISLLLWLMPASNMLAIQPLDVNLGVDDPTVVTSATDQISFTNFVKKFQDNGYPVIESEERTYQTTENDEEVSYPYWYLEISSDRAVILKDIPVEPASAAVVTVSPIAGMTFEQFQQNYTNAGYTIMESSESKVSPQYWRVKLGKAEVAKSSSVAKASAADDSASAGLSEEDTKKLNTNVAKAKSPNVVGNKTDTSSEGVAAEKEDTKEPSVIPVKNAVEIAKKIHPTIKIIELSVATKSTPIGMATADAEPIDKMVFKAYVESYKSSGYTILEATNNTGADKADKYSGNGGAFFGDSIAQGTADAAKRDGVSHDREVERGQNAGVLATRSLPKSSYSWVVISAGINNPNNNTEEHLRTIRRNITADKVIWIVPNNTNDPTQKAKGIVEKVGKTDTLVYYIPNNTDGYHPKSYDKVWDDIKKLIKDIKSGGKENWHIILGEKGSIQYPGTVNEDDGEVVPPIGSISNVNDGADGVAEPLSLEMPDHSDKYATSFGAYGAPRIEYDKKRTDIIDPTSTTMTTKDTVPREIFKPLANGLIEQGLDEDKERGVSNSSARRDSPSKVFGLLSPRGNTIHIDDGHIEENNEFIRIRTRSGTQVLVHESSGYVYINSKLGRSWVQIGDDGIDMYSADSISLSSDADINLSSKGTTNIDATGGLNITAGNIAAKSTGPINLVGGEFLVKSLNDIFFKAVGDFGIETGGQYGVNAEGDARVASCGQNIRTASAILDNSPGAPLPEGITEAQEVSSVITRRPTKEPYTRGSLDVNHIGSNGQAYTDVVGSDGSISQNPVDIGKISPDDIEWIATAMMDEARGEGEDGMAAVAAVIMNRVAAKFTQGTKDASWGTTPKGIILAKSQFSGFNTAGKKPAQREAKGKLLFAKYSSGKNKSLFERAKIIAEQVQSNTYKGGKVYTFVRGQPGTLWFFNPSLARPPWAKSYKFAGTIRNHAYYWSPL